MKHVKTNMFTELRGHAKQYLLQSILATLSVFIVFLLLNMHETVIIASIGGSAFIVFAMPKSITAATRHVIGGHVVGIFSGFLCSLLPHDHYLLSLVVYSLAVGVSMFLMVITDTEHPPAAATALGFAIQGFAWKVALILLASVVVLSIIHWYFRHHMHDLT